LRLETRWIIGGVIIVSMVVGIAYQEDELTYSRTSFGTRYAGHRAAFELLDELEVPVRRSYARAADLPARATVWWVEPFGLCDEVSGESLASGRSDVWRTERWIAEGGTAVIWLPAGALDCLGGATFAGVAIPQREGDLAPEPAGEACEAAGSADSADSADSDDANDSDDADDAAPGEDHETTEDEAEAVVEEIPERVEQGLAGPLAPVPRTFEGRPLWRFLQTQPFDTRDWDVRAYLDEEPFVIQREIGAGRLVLVADGRLASNGWLGIRDASLFVTDVAYAFGAPAFDERQHGLLPRRSAFAYLATSAALPALLGVVGVAALLAWSGAAMPRPRLHEPEGEPPTLEVFVDSLATLYARTSDRASLLDRYREFTMNQLKRTLQLPPETSRKTLLERLETANGVNRERLRRLFESGDPPAGAADFFERAAELDGLVREVAP